MRAARLIRVKRLSDPRLTGALFRFPHSVRKPAPRQPQAKGEQSPIRRNAVQQHRPAPKGFRWVFVKRFTHWRSKKVIEASNHGREAFCFLVRERKGS
jgi:hypothetical protein